jgi:hypothetical protein
MFTNWTHIYSDKQKKSVRTFFEKNSLFLNDEISDTNSDLSLSYSVTQVYSYLWATVTQANSYQWATVRHGPAISSELQWDTGLLLPVSYSETQAIVTCEVQWHTGQ